MSNFTLIDLIRKTMDYTWNTQDFENFNKQCIETLNNINNWDLSY